MNKESFSHLQRGDNNECALVFNDLNYNTFGSGGESITYDNWLYNCRDIVQEEPGTAINLSSRKLHDPYHYASPRNVNTFWGTVFHIYMVSAGPALFLMPESFFAVGYFTASFLMFAIFLIYWHNLRMIVWSESHLCKIKHRPYMTYPETIFHSFDVGPGSIRWFAPYSYLIIRLLFLITWSGAFELVMISTNLKVICESALDVNLDVQTAMLIIFAPMLLLTWIHKLKYLIPLSMIADGLSLFCILIVILHIFIDPQPLTIESDAGSWRNVPVFLGSTLYALNATGLMLPLKNEMKDPRRYNSRWGVLTVTFPIISFVYTFFGLFCSLKFGSRLLQYNTVIECLGMNKMTLEIIMSLYTLSIALQYPLITYVAFDTIWNGFLRNKQNKMKHKSSCEYAVRTAVYFASFTAGYGLPYLNFILSICGTIGTVVDSFIFPPLVNSLVMWKLDGNVRKVKITYIKNGFIVLTAMFVLYAGLSIAVPQLIKSFTGFGGKNIA